MRRWLIRHEQSLIPFVVGEQKIFSGEFPRPGTEMPYFWNSVNDQNPADTAGSAQIEWNGHVKTVHYHREGAVMHLVMDGFFYRFPFTDVRTAGDSAGTGLAVQAEIPGRIVKILVKPGDVVDAGQPVVVQEAMKMEITLRSPGALLVDEILTSEGAQVQAEAVLVRFRAKDEQGKA